MYDVEKSLAAWQKAFMDLYDRYSIVSNLLQDVLREVDARDSCVDLNPDLVECIRDMYRDDFEDHEED